ncbi:SPASM domain-containing protein [Taklimakanibacter deserti]|uniref:SPASM domain-containing protein n=1 Tax=Taklimakanibacter deserti TaxID=2267839 RepID=UPI000E65DE61
MADKFCILPWKHLTVGTEGAYKLCCMAHKVMTEGGAPMSVYHHSLEEAWNSDYMRDVRRAMLAGEAVPDCQGCYKNEAASGQSYRTTVAASMMDRPVEEVRKETVANEFRVDEQPNFFKLELGSLCNLECRMCGSLTSSQIERDPVHSRWAPSWSFDGIPLVVWNADSAIIGPHPLVGVSQSGFSATEKAAEHRYCWTGDCAGIDLKLDEATIPNRLEIKLNEAGQRDQMFDVLVNGVVHARQSATRGNRQVKIDLRHTKLSGALQVQIRVTSPGGKAALDHKGMAVEEIRLFRQPSAATELPNRMLYSRLPGRTLWENEDSFIFGELFRNPGKIDRLYITGGEPLLMKRVTEIVDFLIQSKNNHILLEFNTNCTKVSSEILEKLGRFDSLNIALSIDGVGDTYEYIRFPAKWKVVDQNVRLLQQLPNAFICVTPVVQIYNALNLADLCRYCDDLGLDFTLSNILHWPEQLRLSLMPPAARLLAAERLREYADNGCRQANLHQVLSVADHLETLEGMPRPEAIRRFMLFTNDLDVTRAQKFADVHSELHRSFGEIGYPWTSETRYARVSSTPRARVSA